MPGPRVPLTRPKAKLNLRHLPAGGVVVDPVESAPNALRFSSSATFLIHGFNVNYGDAQSAYQSFAANVDFQKRRNFFWVFWPGDVSDGLVRSTLGYPLTPARAQDSADRLADYMVAELVASGRSLPQELRIIAHSMGCRLALELVKFLKQRGGFKMISLTLMAAAVQRYRVLPGARDRDDLRTAMAEFDDTTVYHSQHDRVLRWAFRPGQIFDASLFSGFVRNRDALGRNGLGRQNQVKDKTKDSLTDLRHSQYWGDKPTAQKIAKSLPGLARQVRNRGVEGRTILKRTVSQ